MGKVEDQNRTEMSCNSHFFIPFNIHDKLAKLIKYAITKFIDVSFVTNQNWLSGSNLYMYTLCYYKAREHKATLLDFLNNNRRCLHLNIVTTLSCRATDIQH